jgi:hypothetical protein
MFRTNFYKHRNQFFFLTCLYFKSDKNSILYTKVKKFMIIAKIRARGVPRVLRRKGYKGLLHRGLYTIFSTTRYVTLGEKFYFWGRFESQ